MRKNYDRLCDLLSKLVKFFISFLNFFIQSLIFNLELLKVNKMETISKLFFLFQDFLFVSKSVSQSNVLKSVLMHFLVLKRFTFLPFFKSFLGNFLTSSWKNSILGDTSLQFFELTFDLMALRLLFIELCLELRCHFVVSILSLLQVNSYLMYVCKGIEILMLIHVNIWLLVKLLKVLRVLENDLLLELLVLSSQLILLSQLFFNGFDKIIFHFILTW